jgi:3-oxoacyl-[acyl-carrier protein] reductase
VPDPSSVLYRKRVCITGATGGLGRAMAKAFLVEGCKLLLVSRTQATLEAFRDELMDERDTEIDVCAADLAADDGIDAILETMRHVGGIDVLINNAGVFPVTPVQNVTREEFDTCFAVNVRAPFLLTQGLVRDTVSHGHGHCKIVNIGSSSAFAGFPHTSVYCGSKHALLGISRALFAELRGGGIRVFSVNPGSIKTRMGEHVPGQDFETFLEPDQIAAFVIDLLRQERNMISEEIRLNRLIVR